MTNFLRILGIFLSPPAAAFGIYFAFKKYWDVGSQDAKVGLLILGLYSGFFLICAIAQELRYSRKTRYAESSHLIHKVFDKCLEGASQQIKSEKEIQQCSELICNYLAHTFSIITGIRCSTCIKVLDSNPKENIDGKVKISVSTFCRDEASEDRGKSDPEGAAHWLDQNSDFLDMFKTIDKPKGGTYFANNLPSKYNYTNTSFDIYGGKPKDIPIPIIRGFTRNITWSLPYKSTIGAVIYPIIPSTKDDRLIGFLCVDSGSRRAFRKRYDIELIRAISGALYPMMYKWTEVVTNN
jgi:hypothetical protein